MTSGRDRRQHERRVFQREVFCYIDGRRFDARSEDLSSGGMFLRTDGRVEVPIGTIVGLVVKGDDDADRPVYLFARVVRCQCSPIDGLGLRWEKAVATGEPDGLIRFLEGVLAIPAPRLTQRPVTGKDLVRHVFAFPPPEVPEPAPPVAGDARIPDSAVTSSGPGILTKQVRVQDAVFPADLDASASFEGVTVPVRLKRMGVAAMSVVAAVAPLSPSARVAIAIPPSPDNGPIPLVAHCRIARLRMPPADPDPGLDLEIESVDESGQPGAWQRFLKFHHYRELAGA